MAHGTTAAVSSVRIEKNKRGYNKLWDYFVFFVHSDKKKVVCNICKVISPYPGNMTNLETHLERHHLSEFSIYLKDSGKSTNSGATQQMSLEASITQSQPLSRLIYIHERVLGYQAGSSTDHVIKDSPNFLMKCKYLLHK